MQLDAPFKLLQNNVDITALRQAVLGVTEEEWNLNQYRQQQFTVAKDVETLLFKINGDNLSSGENPAHTDIWEESWSKWKHLVNPIVEQSTQGYLGVENMFINKCLIPRLRPNMEIPEHIDVADSFTYSHRIHVPLITNPDVVFMIDGVHCVMEEGKAYEINNKAPHSVVNNGTTPRIHLLFDMYIPKG